MAVPEDLPRRLVFPVGALLSRPVKVDGLAGAIGSAAAAVSAFIRVEDNRWHFFFRVRDKNIHSIEAQNEWLIHWEDRWASLRIHGRVKRQVEELFQEEKPYLQPLPLESFRYFKQETRTVYDDGAIQVGNSYYAANPAPLSTEVPIRIYEDQTEILDPIRMEVIRRHPISRRPGSVMMDPADRI